jgi:hypothetical protein
MKIFPFLRGAPRHRSLFLLGGAVLATALSLSCDPDGGLSTLLGGVAIVQAVWAVAASHWARKALMDYPEADMRRLFARAGEESTGAGLALIAIAMVLVGLLMVFSPRAHATELPAGAVKYLPALKAEQQRLWPDHPDPAILGSLVEQESCASLKSRSCWNPTARLKSAREEGAGMGQITRTWRADGAQRFDSLAGLRTRYASELSTWNWGNVYERPDLQLRAIVLMSRDAYRPFRTTPAALAFGDAGYNGGAAGVQQERRACALTVGCDAGLWFKHVELHCLKSRQPLYGGRTACDINREHVRNVLMVRRQKYADWPWA